jgi:glutamine---fructose-6-phosphate transaminase (isomerizing)
MAERGERMRAEIHEQPEAIAATVAAEGPAVRELVARLVREGIEHVLVAARGTSDNAALYAIYAFGAISSRMAGTAMPSLFTCYRASLDMRKTLLVGVSQSGAATDVIEVLHAGRERGAVTCALTNTGDSPICAAAEHVLLTQAHEETSVAATKTYTAALALFHQLATLWAGREDLADCIHRVPGWMADALAREDAVAERAERFRFMETCHWLGRGMNLCTAREAALKMAECCYVVPSHLSTADFMHGPIATTDAGFPCFIVAAPGPTFPSVMEVIAALRQREAELIVLSSEHEALAAADLPLPLPAVPEECSPMVAAVAAQLLALHIARTKGLNPDQPRGLHKVTLTR